MTRKVLNLIYVVAGEGAAGDVHCSMCDEEVQCVTRLNVGRFTRGWRKWLPQTVEEPWIGLCIGCVKRLFQGFYDPAVQARLDEADRRAAAPSECT